MTREDDIQALKTRIHELEKQVRERKTELPQRRILDWFSDEDKAKVSQTVQELFF